MQDRNVVDEFIDVVRTVELGEAGAAPQTSIEALERNVCKAAVRLSIVVGATETKWKAVVGLAVALARAVRRVEGLVEIVRAKPERIDDRGVRDVIPLRP